MKRLAAGLLLPLLSAIALTTLLLQVLSISPAAAGAALVEGGLGGIYPIGLTLTKTTPILLSGLGVAVAFKARFWNIGAEGQLYLGALFAVLAGIYLPLPPVVHPLVVLAAGFGGGAAWALLAAGIRVWRGVNEVVTTLLLNTVAIYVVGWLVGGPIREPNSGYPRSAEILASARLGMVLPGSRLHAGILLALAAVAFIWWVLARTRLGFQLRLLGANPRALRYTGVAVNGALLKAAALSGGLAGLAGAAEVLGVHYRLPAGFSPGYGFDGITVALLGQLHPLGVLASSVFVGLLRAGAGAMQRAVGAPTAIVFVLQGIAVFAALLGLRALERARKAQEEAKSA